MAWLPFQNDVRTPNSCDNIVSNGNNIFIKKKDKLIVLFDRYKGVSPYRAKNDTEKMVDMINKNDIRRLFTLFISF